MTNNIKPECERFIRELEADEALETAKLNIKTACGKLAPLPYDELGIELLKALDTLDRARKLLGQKMLPEDAL
jgi:hypothetical protein